MLTRERLKELLEYNLATGFFRWNVTKGTAKAGDFAGSKNKSGYLLVGIDGDRYSAHRLAWLYVKGYFPENCIDHVDRIKHHNWFSNLREVSQRCNARNTGLFSNNTSCVKGVCWNKKHNKWIARIRVREQIHLGFHKDFTEAVCHRLAAEQCLDWHDCDANSSAYQYVQFLFDLK